jgi:hypothetical protein
MAGLQCTLKLFHVYRMKEFYRRCCPYNRAHNGWGEARRKTQCGNPSAGFDVVGTLNWFMVELATHRQT